MQNYNLDPNTIFERLTQSFWKYLFASLVETDAGKNKQGRSVDLHLILFLIILALLGYAGVESIHLIFRNNFGKKGINMTRLIISVIAFGLLAFIAYRYYAGFTVDDSTIGSRTSFLYTTIFYSALSILLVYKSFNSVTNDTNILEAYRGDSYLLGFLTKGEKGWKQSTVQNFYEPLTLLSVGVFLTPINLFWGIPLIFCAISFWIHAILESSLKVINYRNYLSDQRGYFDENSFISVVSDD